MVPSWLMDAWCWVINSSFFSGTGGAILGVFIGGIFFRNKNTNTPLNELQDFLLSSVRSEIDKYDANNRANTERRLSEFGIDLYKSISCMPCLHQIISFPEVQYSINNAAIQYIRTSDEETRKLLLNAVKIRLESNKNSIISANMDSIISNILLLTNIQIKIIFSLCALKYFKIETNNFEEFKNNIEEIANEILLCDKITTVDLNGIVAHGFMVDDLLAMMWNSEIRLGHDMVQCNQKVFEENSFDISEHEKVSVLISSHFKKLYEASNIFTELNYKRLSCTYSGIILTDLIFSLKFPHIKHAHLEDILDSLK